MTDEASGSRSRGVRHASARAVSGKRNALRMRVVASAIHLHAERSLFATGLASVLSSVSRVLRQLLVQVNLRLRHRPEHPFDLDVPRDHGRIRGLGRLEGWEALTHEVEPALALERELPLPLVEDRRAGCRLVERR